MTVRVRFAPSPTGFLHIGGARTALFNWLFARHHQGRFILRIEDTDRKRTVPGALEDILASLRWLGLDWDEGPEVGGPYAPYVQSQRLALYQEHARWLLEQGLAYKCFATPRELAAMRREQKARGLPLGYDRRYRDTPAAEVRRLEEAGRAYVIRFKMPLSGETVLHDAIRGAIVIDNRQLTDLVLLKSDGYPTYHLANVVDDHLMGITHIMRADEWINTGPIHVNLYRAFAWQPPVYAHLPVVLSPSGRGKLSKRDQAFQDDGQQVLVQVREFRDAGYLPEAVVNFLTNVGWSFGDDREMFSLAEAVERFDLASINPAPTRLPYSKLEWLNGQYIQALSPEALAQALQPFLAQAGQDINKAALEAVAPGIRQRLKRLSEAGEWLQFLNTDVAPDLDAEELVHKQLPLTAAAIAFTQARDFVRATPEFNLQNLDRGLTAIGEANTVNGKAGPFLGRLRLAITGQAVSPPVFESMLALGREQSLARLEAAVAALGEKVAGASG